MPDSLDRADDHQPDLPDTQTYTLRLRDARISPRVGGIAGTVGGVIQAGPEDQTGWSPFWVRMAIP
jgi:hypothetical protein